MRPRAWTVSVLAVLAVLGWGCGDDASTTASERRKDPAVVGVLVLDGWSKQLARTVIDQRTQSTAFRAGDMERAERYERRVFRGLRVIEKYGRDARKAFVGEDEPSREARAVIASGDAWTEWAYRLVSDPPAGNFEKARKLADLGAVAVGRYRRAYEVVGGVVPLEFQAR